ncbi:MAG: cell wall-binding repeat-containing protein, partial [Desulfitobacteriaceae bacterium]
MRKFKKSIASLSIIAMVLMMIPVQVFAVDTPAPTRLADVDRVGTAIAIANNGWAAGASTVIVAPADDANLVDALAVAPLAGQLGAPILMTYKDSLDARVQAEISTLKATTVYAVGALSPAVVNSLNAISGATVTQIQGADRFATAAQVAAKLIAPAGTFVVAYNGLADAMSVASYAAANKYAIMIADTNGNLPASETAVGTKTYTVGGQVAAIAGATSLKGADRYATNDAVLKALTYTYDNVYVANGETLVDALAGSVLAAKTNSPIVLANTAGATAAAGVNKNMTSSSKVIAFGGTAVVPNSVVAGLGYNVVVVPPSNGVVTVTSTAVPSRYVAIGEKLVKIGTLNVTAATAAGLTGMKVSRSGLSKDADISSIVIYDGNQRLNVPAVLGNSVADFDFTNPVEMTAGQSKALDVYMNISSASSLKAGSQIIITVNELRGSNVTGFTPLVSNVFTTTSVKVGTLTVTSAGGAPVGDLDPNGTVATLTQFKFEATDEDVLLNRIVLTQNGSAGASDIKDFTLWNSNGTQIAGPVTLGSDRTIIFTFPSGLLVTNGGSNTLDVKATIVGGSGRSVQLAVANDVDVLGVGQTYGTSIVADNTSALPEMSSRQIAPGSLIISKDASSPATATLAEDTKDQTFGVVKVQAVGEAIQLRTVNLSVYTKNSLGAETAAYNNLQNVKLLVDGQTIGSSTGTDSGFYNSKTLNIQLSKPITVQTATPVLITVTSDILNTKTPQFVKDDSISLVFEGVTEYARMTSGTIVTGDLASVQLNQMTIGNQGLTVHEVATKDIDAYIGQSAVVLDSFDVKHNMSGAIQLSSITFSNNAASNGKYWSDFKNLKLTDTAGHVLTNVVANPNTSSATLQLTLTTPAKVDPNVTVRVQLVGDIASADNTNPKFQFAGGAATSVTSGNDVGPDDLTNSGGANVFAVHGVGKADIVATYSASQNIKDNYNVQKSAKDVKVAGFTLKNDLGTEDAIISSITVDKIDPKLNGIRGLLDSTRLANIRIVDAAGSVLGTATGFAAGSDSVEITLSNPITLEKGSTHNREISVLADFTAAASKYQYGVEFYLTAMEAHTAFTGATADQKSMMVDSKAYFVVVPSTVTVTSVDVPDPKTSGSNLAVGKQIAKFSFTNNGTSAVVLQQVYLADTISSSTSVLTGQKVTLIDASNGDVLGTSVAFVGSNAAVTLSKPGGGDFLIDAGATKTIIVRNDGVLTD